MEQGLYEALITQLIQDKLSKLDSDKYHISTSAIDKQEAAEVLSKQLARTIKYALNLVRGEKAIEQQITIANKIILLLKKVLEQEELEEDLIEVEGKLLRAIFVKMDTHFTNLDIHLKDITPYTRLTQSELFTGGNGGLSLESELRKEILSSNRIDLLVSFIKFKGIIILEKELKKFTDRGGRLRVITTTYMGASDYKAIRLLSKLPNTEVKISYNTGNERLHAKAYLFYRNTGFHTGYIGSSNFSRSALTDGLEWNVKITSQEISRIINKFRKTFEAYWESNDFEIFDDSIHKEKLIHSLSKGKIYKREKLSSSFFDIKPYSYQAEILEQLEVERTVHNRFKNLIVAATGTGKTIISAFDYKNYKKAHPRARLLFIAHRKEILVQAMSSFQGILKDNNFGELWGDGYTPDNMEYVFASIQTINNRLKQDQIDLSPNFYDFIIIDECHHQKASSYRRVINYFEPKVLLGLTATPERMDGGNILEDFGHRIAAEIRLPEALNKKLLCPFQYFGITDSVDLSNVNWDKGKYLNAELNQLYTANNRRTREIIDALDKYTKDIHENRAVGFCASIEHAEYMAREFNKVGIQAAYLTSANSKDRDILRKQLQTKELNYLFVVDIFNEGVDIPEIDTVLFLRPTESLTIFLQQLGRGLRLAEDKDCLTVLDFVGNARPEYNFQNKFRALIGKTNRPVQKELEDNFPHLPLGCSVVLEEKAKDFILENIKKATSANKKQIINKIALFKQQTNLNLSLKNFLNFNNITIQLLYKRGCWKRLCQQAEVIDDFEETNEKSITKTIQNKWLSCKSYHYFKFVLRLAQINFQIDIRKFDQEEQLMLLMLHYDVWQRAAGFANLEESIRQIGANPILVEEMIEVLEYLIDRIDFKELGIQLSYPMPLKLHARYTRDQILAAFQFSSFEKQSPNREGVAENKELNTELLFVTLSKSEENFSPTTMYEDYAISEKLFHWQSQNSSRPDSGKGLSYIKHIENDKTILLFIREQKKDEHGNTMGYVFIGDVQLKEHEGSKPMNITWKLEEAFPHYLWKYASKLVAG